MSRGQRRRFNPELAWDHIDELAAEHKITVRPCSSRIKAEAHYSTRQVWVPPQRAPLDYLLALHELGHIAEPESQRHFRQYADGGEQVHEVCCEAAAWAWAVSHIHPEIRKRLVASDWQAAADWFATYLSTVPRVRRR